MMWLNRYEVTMVTSGLHPVKQVNVGDIQPKRIESKIEVVSVFPIITSPLLSTVKWFEGKGSSQIKYRYLDKEFHVMSHPKTNVEVEVPLFVKMAWQSTYYKRRDEDLLDLDYYESNFDSYSDWSFGVHQRQLESLFQYIPENLKIVAPGDGWGVAKASTKKHTVLSTDLVRGIDFTESIEQTLDRLMKDDVLVLSYVWNLISWETKTRIMSLGNPIVIVDSYPYLQGFLRVGEGIFVMKAVPWFPTSGLNFTPEGFHEQSLAFTENLLNIETRSTVITTNAYHYHKVMRPLAKESKHGTVICSTIEEAMKTRSYLPYLAPIGKFYSEPWDTSLDPSTSWATRQIYRLPREGNHDVIRNVRRKSHWHIDRDFFYFCFSFPTVITFKQKKATVVTDFTISVIDTEETAKFKFTLMTITKNHLMWKANRLEPVIWKRTPFSEWCAYLYLNETGHSERGWKRALFDNPVISKPVLSDWEEHVLSHSLILTTIIPMFSNDLAFDDDWWTHQQCEVEIKDHGVMLFPTSTSLDTLETLLVSLYGKRAQASTTGTLWEAMVDYGWKVPVKVSLFEMSRDPPNQAVYNVPVQDEEEEKEDDDEPQFDWSRSPTVDMIKDVLSSWSPKSSSSSSAYVGDKSDNG